MPGPSDERVDAWRGLLRSHAEVVRAIDADMRRTGALPLNWYDVLLELNSAPGRRLRMTDLGSRVVLSRTRVSRIVDDLARAGLVERSPDPDDRRGAYATMTPEGRVAFKRSAPLYLDAIERHFTALLTDRERRTIATALARVTAHHRD